MADDLLRQGLDNIYLQNQIDVFAPQYQPIDTSIPVRSFVQTDFTPTLPPLDLDTIDRRLIDLKNQEQTDKEREEVKQEIAQPEEFGLDKPLEFSEGDVDNLDDVSFLEKFFQDEEPATQEEIMQKIDARTKMFKGLLGMDEENTKYLTFLEIAKSGLALAAAPGGRSFVQNFADAFQNLPAFLQKIRSTQDAQDKQLKMSALQAVLDEERNKSKSQLERFKALPDEFKNLMIAGIDPRSPRGQAYLLDIKDPGEKIQHLNYLIDIGLLEQNDPIIRDYLLGDSKNLVLNILKQKGINTTDDEVKQFMLGQGKDPDKIRILEYAKSKGIIQEGEIDEIKSILGIGVLDEEIVTGGTGAKNLEVFSKYGPNYKTGLSTAQDDSFVTAVYDYTTPKINPITGAQELNLLSNAEINNILSAPIEKIKRDFSSLLTGPSQNAQLVRAVETSDKLNAEQKQFLLPKRFYDLSDDKKTEFADKYITTPTDQLSPEDQEIANNLDLRALFGLRGFATTQLNRVASFFTQEAAIPEESKARAFIETVRSETLNALRDAYIGADRETEAQIQRYEKRTAEYLDRGLGITDAISDTEDNIRLIKELKTRLQNILADPTGYTADQVSSVRLALPALEDALRRQNILLSALGVGPDVIIDANDVGDYLDKNLKQ